MEYSFIATVFVAVLLYPTTLVFIQNNGYRIPFKNKKFLLDAAIDVFPSALFFTAFISYTASLVAIISLDVLLAVKAVYTTATARIKPRFTPRAVRLSVVVTTVFLGTIISLGVCMHSLVVPFFTVPVFYSILFSCLPILGAIENLNNKKGLKRARLILDSVPLKIGITGSAGKTTVKNILTAMLSKKYTVMASLGNYNTPIGISKSLEDYNGEEIFIAEIGARKKGDVKELLDLIHPSIGVLTTINPQHSESFGTIDDVYNEKSLLIKNSPRLSVVNADNEYISDHLDDLMPDVAVGRDISAEIISSDLDGTRFILRDGPKSIYMETVLLGRAAVTDVMLAYAVASRLGVEDDDIVSAVRDLSYVPHRMEKISSHGVTIIDDGYNSNIEGADFAIQFFSRIDGRKVVCAQGIVEQGKNAAKVNKELGEKFSRVFDVIVTTGCNSKYIVKGANEAGYRGEIYSVRNMKEVRRVFSLILSPGDIVYLNNDVPDFM